MLTLIGLIAALFVGGFFGWRLTAKRERLLGYAEAVDDQFKRMRDTPRPPRLTAASYHLRALKGGKK